MLKSDRDRLLSHRLRGFDRFENSAAGMSSALAAGVRHVEFDVCLTTDGVPVATHDPFVIRGNGQVELLENLTLEQARSRPLLENLATAEAMVGIFARQAGPDARMHIDIKVIDAVAPVCALLKRFHMLERTIIVSWRAEVLSAMHSAALEVRLCFSHWSFSRIGWLYAAARTAVAGNLLPIASGLCRPFVPGNSALIDMLEPVFHPDGDPLGVRAEEKRRGAVRASIVPDTVEGAMLEMLQRSRGMVCLPWRMATVELIRRYHDRGLEVALFSAESAVLANHICAQLRPDILYVDASSIFNL